MSLTKVQKQQELYNIEQELIPLAKQTGKTWISVYKLLQKVENDELFTATHHSYTAWINDFAKKNNITISLLWKKKKAGKFYSNYAEYYAKQNIIVPSIEQIDYDPEILVMIEKVTAGNMVEARKMLNKNSVGSLTRYDLKTIWNSAKAERQRKGLPVMRTNAHDKDIFQDFSYQDYDINKANTFDILTALCRPSWLIAGKIVSGQFYQHFSKIPLCQGDSELAIVENYTHMRADKNFTLHFIKIIMDTNIPELPKCYPDYADVYWIASSFENPNEIIRWVSRYPDIGLILYAKQSDNLYIYKNAKYNILMGKNRNALIEQLFISLL